MSNTPTRRYGVRGLLLNACIVVGVPSVLLVGMSFTTGRNVGYPSEIQPDLEGRWVLHRVDGCPRELAPEELHIWALRGDDGESVSARHGMLEANGQRVELELLNTGMLAIRGDARLRVLPMLQLDPSIHVLTHNYSIGRCLDHITLCSGGLASGCTIENRVSATYERD